MNSKEHKEDLQNNSPSTTQNHSSQNPDFHNFQNQIPRISLKHSSTSKNTKSAQPHNSRTIDSTFHRSNSPRNHTPNLNQDSIDSIDSIMLDTLHSENTGFIIKPFSLLERRKKELRKTKSEIQKAQKAMQDKIAINAELKRFRAWRLFLLLSIFASCFVIFILTAYSKILMTPPNMDPYNKYSRSYPWSSKVDIDLGARGQILSADNFVLATSKKLYSVGVYVPSIIESKKEVLVNLLHIYANFDKNTINTALLKGGNAIISDEVSAIDAINLKLLNTKLSRLGVYKKCVFTYINKNSLKDSELKTMIAHAQITQQKGRPSTLDLSILNTLQRLQDDKITESQALENLNIALVEYKNKKIDLNKECYTPIFAYNSDVKDGANTRIDRGLDIAVNKIQREYPFDNFMQPLLGFTNYARKVIDNVIYDDKLRLIAQSGVEKYRDGILSAKHDGRVSSRADKSGNIIYNKYLNTIEKEDGFNITLTIPLSLQVKLQRILESANEQYRTQQIVAGIMDPTTGEILAFGSSASFNPNIGQRDKDIATKMRFLSVERSFEPGSTIKPLVFSYLVNNKMIDFKKEIDLNNGIYKLRTFTIRDSIPLKSARPEWILIKSSNIGMTKLTKNLSGTQMQNLFKIFGIGDLTGIDIANEASGLLPDANKLSREVEKGTASYGYGLRMTFIQLLRSYGVFNNGGYLVNPHITKSLVSPQGSVFYPALESPRQVISTKSAQYMQTLLHRVVKEGTAKKANVDGLTIGGKTGTAREISKEATIYNGSFFGYASDGKKTYTIGVVAYGSLANEDYYGGQTAAPTFARIANLLVQEGYLVRK